MEKFNFLNKDKINQLPKTLGVYTFKKGAKLLYIGKAANIRERVKNHMQRPVAFWEQTLLRQGFGGQVGYIKTDSEIEALILEANLIKKYQPKYNVIWKDDKNYFYVGITKECYPRVFITHQPKKLYPKPYTLNPKYVGPFVDGKALKQTLKVLRKVFPYRTCRSLPKRPCLWYQLGRCLAPCLLESKLGKLIPGGKTQIKKDSQRNAKNLRKILEKGKIQVLKDLKKEMKAASAFQDFEKAAKIRDQIGALEKVLAHAKVFEEFYLTQKINWLQIQKILQQISKTKKSVARIEAYDVSNIQGQEATGSMVTFINGLPDKNFYRRFKIKNRVPPFLNERKGRDEGEDENEVLIAVQGKPNDVAMIKEVLTRRFKHLEWGLPDFILIDGGIAQLNAALNCKLQIANCKLIKVVALAKKENKLYIEGQEKPIALKSFPREVFNLILQLRDEAHRFAISYHRKLREIDLRPKNWYY